MRRTALAATLLLVATPLAAQAPPIPETAIANVRARVDGGWAPSVVVGIVDGSGTRYYAYGRTGIGEGAPASERTVYEIGSFTKAFTGLLLADMARRGEVALDDPVQSFLPEGTRVPAAGDTAPVTLRLLAAHRSGLPRLPTNLAPRDAADPYADYDAARLADYLAGATLVRPPGSAYEYSNLGAGLLGYALARRAGTGYEALVAGRVLRPLGLHSTMITLTDEARSRLARPTAGGEPASNWNFDVLAGAGALRSTAEDMTRFLAAALGLTPSPLGPAFLDAAEPRFDAGPVMRIGLGWHVRERGADRIVWHNGGTGGYRSWAGYDPVRRVGAVVLTNAGDNGVDDLGFHLLDPASPLQPVMAQVMLPEATLEEYVGSYALAPAFVITVRRRGDRLFGQATGQPEFRLYASARDEFFLRVVPARMSFTRGADGAVDALVLRQGGRDQRAVRQ